MSERRHTSLFVFGTRPEAIKMAPVVRAFQGSGDFRTVVCVTGQHRTMLDQVLSFFELKPEFDLNLMQPNQSLSMLAGRAIASSAEVIEKVRPGVVFVQGDTTTAFAAAFAAFQARVPVGHIEAGLRSYRKDAPFPEEMNRVLVSHLADLHFAPVESARGNLAREGVTSNVHVVGNTVVDALLLGLQLIKARGDGGMRASFPMLKEGRKLLLVTIHRRESFGGPLVEVFGAIRELSEEPGLEIVYPVHLNPNVRDVAHQLLSGRKNVHLIEPLGYADFIWLMSKASLILTDSGGIQEEAPSLGIPVLVAREVTERPEGVAEGCAKLVGCDRERIVREARDALMKPDGAGVPKNPYGDGKASTRILELTREYLNAGEVK